MTGKKLTDHPTDKVISEKKQSYPKYQIKIEGLFSRIYSRFSRRHFA